MRYVNNSENPRNETKKDYRGEIITWKKCETADKRAKRLPRKTIRRRTNERGCTI